MRIVIDASAMADLVWPRREPSIAASSTLAAPHLLDLEIAQLARRATRQGVLSSSQAQNGILRLQRMRALTRFSHVPLLERIWQLRDNITSYDASYVALAETLDVPLLTRDTRLAAAAERYCAVVVPE